MDTKKLKKIFELIKENDIKEFSIIDKDFELKIKRGIDLPTEIVEVKQQPIIEKKTVTFSKKADDLEKNIDNNEVDESYHKIISPIIGTFYSAPAPGEPPFIKVGDTINVGDTICIVEAMKIMNEIKSDVSGVVKKILVKNEESVKKDQTLVLIDKA